MVCVLIVDALDRLRNPLALNSISGRNCQANKWEGRGAEQVFQQFCGQQRPSPFLAWGEAL